MANEKEPQSYGSGGDWVTGDVGEEVNRLKGHPNSQHGDFYESRHDSERSAPEQGGKVSPQPAASDDAGSAAPVNKGTKAMGGAKRGGFFRDRDYK
jgi:hypothetical protein